jgi:hypothetical protein
LTSSPARARRIDPGLDIVVLEKGAAGRIDVIVAALQSRLRVDDFEQLDLAYSPPFAPTGTPLLIAAQQLIKEL